MLFSTMLPSRAEVVFAAWVPDVSVVKTIRAEIDRDRARLVEVLTPSPDRVAPFCPSFTICGGCAVQTLAFAPYAEWKRGLVADGLSRAKIETEIAPLVDAHALRRGSGERAGQRDGEVRRAVAGGHAVAAVDEDLSHLLLRAN
jgi:tRNA/tmRNA/rRNA uracil-C5-methylase (TrmA/RlmC/RlmD family)